MNEHFIKIKYVLYYTRICANSGIRKLDDTKRITSIQQSQTDNRDYFEIVKILLFQNIYKKFDNSFDDTFHIFPNISFNVFKNYHRCLRIAYRNGLLC